MRIHGFSALTALMIIGATAHAQSGTLDGDELTSSLTSIVTPNFWNGTQDPEPFTGGSPGPELSVEDVPFGSAIATATLDADNTTIAYSFTAELSPGFPLFLPSKLMVDGIDDRIAGATLVSPQVIGVDVTVQGDAVIIDALGISPLSSFTEIVVELDLRPELGFAEEPQSTDITEGQPLVLSAPLTGSRDDIQIRWLRDGAPLTNDNRISGADTETLVIDPVVPADAGYYTMQAISQLGAFNLKGDEVAVDLRGGPLLVNLFNLLSPTALYDPPNSVPGVDAPVLVTVGDGPEIEKELTPATLAYAADFRNGSRLRFSQFVNDAINLSGTFTLTVSQIDTPVAAAEIVSDTLGVNPANNTATVLSDSAVQFTFESQLLTPLTDGAATLRLLTENPFVIESTPALVAVRPAPGINPDINNDGAVNFLDVLDLIAEIEAILP